MNGFRIILISSLIFSSICSADTFTNRSTGESFDGFATQQTRAGKTLVRTADSEVSKTINLSEYNVEWNFKGRRNQVIVLPIKDSIFLEAQTACFEKTIESASNQGTLFIVLAIDTPGGREDLMKKMCNAIAKANNCKTVAFICGGENGGAYSAGAIISLACNYIYMADNTAIGAATTIFLSDKGEIKDLKAKYGETVGEKFMSADRAYTASIAEKNGRSPALAKAMVDKDIKVIEVAENGKKEFIEAGDQKPGQSMVRILNDSGKLLTLTADEAVGCGIADGKANSIEELLEKLGASGARVIQNNSTEKVKFEIGKYQRDYQKIMDQSDKISKEIERLSSKSSFLADQYNKVNENFEIGNREQLMRQYSNERQIVLRDLLRNLNSYISLCREALKLNKRCPDLNLNVQSFEEAVNSAQTTAKSVQEQLKNK